MFQDPLALLAIFDDLHNTRDELKRIESSIIETAKSFEESAARVEQSADRIKGMVQQWKADIKEVGTQIGNDLHINGYVALERYVDDLHETSVAEMREIAATVETKLQVIASSATTEWRTLSAAQQNTFHRQLEDIAAAANGLPPFPPRPVTPSAFTNCTYLAKLALVRARRFCIEAKADVSVVSAAALVFIALRLALGPISLPSHLFH
jgi:hypothetical protein